MQGDLGKFGIEVGANEQGGVAKLRIGFILLEQFTLAAFAGFIDALRLAADSGGRSRQIHATWTVMGLNTATVLSSCGIGVVPNEVLRDSRDFDYLAICGGNGFKSETQPHNLTDYIVHAHNQGVKLLGICTGTYALARAGLLLNRDVCLHWNVANDFRQRFPQTRIRTDRIFFDDEDLITCAGSTGAIDLALYLISRHCGKPLASQAVRHMMLYGMRSADTPQAHFRYDAANVRDPRVRRAITIMEQTLDTPPSLLELASQVGVSTRQLSRCFAEVLGESPMSFLRRLRIHYGRYLLEHSTRPISEVALDCGFTDGGHFTREFVREFNERPRDFRNRQTVQADANGK